MLDAFRLPFFQTALVATLVLAGIHAYLGFHIVRRGVIFVDLALAQMAALGVALAVVLRLNDNELGTYALALGMTFVGAATFAWLRSQERNAPLEALSASCSRPRRPRCSWCWRRAPRAPSISGRRSSGASSR